MMPWDWEQPWFTISAVAFAALLVALYVASIYWVLNRRD